MRGDEMQLFYVTGSEGVDSAEEALSPSLWENRLEQVALVTTTEGARRAAGGHGKGVYYVFRDDDLVGTLLCLGEERLDDRVYFYHAPDPVVRHPEGCSCGSPDCPAWQADRAGMSNAFVTRTQDDE